MRLDFFNYLHESLIESVLVSRQQNKKLIIILFALFSLFTIITPIIYYNLYIYNQLQRIDISYSERDNYDLDSNKMTCDCAIPILINYDIIVRDPDYLQPAFKSCLTTTFLKYYPPLIVNSTVRLLMLHTIVFPLNSFSDNHNTYKNIIVNQTNLMYKIGNFAKLQYLSEIKNTFSGYFVYYNGDTLKQITLINQLLAVSENNSSDTYSDLLMTYYLSDKNLDIQLDFLKCYNEINLDDDNVDPLYFVEGLTDKDCMPVDCHLFTSYSFYQSIVLIITFYLAIIGYFICVLQCVYQKATVTGQIINTDFVSETRLNDLETGTGSGTGSNSLGDGVDSGTGLNSLGDGVDSGTGLNSLGSGLTGVDSGTGLNSLGDGVDSGTGLNSLGDGVDSETGLNSLGSGLTGVDSQTDLNSLGDEVDSGTGLNSPGRGRE